MSEGEIPESVQATAEWIATKKAKAEEVVAKRQDLIENPIARFNLGLDGKNPEQFDPSFTEPELTGELLNELRKPLRIPDPETQQKLNTLVLNRGASIDGSPVTVFIPPINNEISRSDDPGIVNHTHYRIQELARNLPDSQLIAFDYPSVGASDQMTEQQLQAFKQGKGFDEIARTQLRILKKMGIKDINIVAQSLGAFTGAHMARLAKEFGIHISSAVLTETPGVLDSSTLDMFKNRLNPENAYMSLYHSATFDPEHLPNVPTGPIKKNMARY